MCVTQLRLISYMGWLELSLKWSSKELGFDEEQTSYAGDERNYHKFCKLYLRRLKNIACVDLRNFFCT